MSEPASTVSEPGAGPEASAPAIAIVDANNFYASCERIFDPSLEGKPIVVLSNNDGCVIARSEEAKAAGIPMGAPWQAIAPEAAMKGVVARSSNYELYGDINARTIELLGRYTPSQEVYSIDESFIRLPGDRRQGVAVAREIRVAMRKLIGIPVSIGIAPSKTLAKLANRGSKSEPSLGGVCHLSAYERDQLSGILGSIDVGDVWGVGRKMAAKYVGLGIRTALELRESSPTAIRRRYGVVQERVVQELRGIDCLPIDEVPSEREQIQFSRSFAVPISTVQELDEVLSVYTQRASARLRSQGSLARAMSCYAATSPFREGHESHAVSVAFPEPTDDPVVLFRAAATALGPQLRSDLKYVRVGVSLFEFVARDSYAALDIFGERSEDRRVGEALDAVAAKFGQESLGLGIAGLRTGRSWTMRREMISPRATTHWDELAVVKAE